ncbi:hypothetical protein [Oharaeibacter diazotrophicus]|uniref:Uncharacterized protein n=1 Tax=Oharaeibacter diazotrophicus TaxID=1920512 RepID=A0A4R6RAD4_9HYPH|nr:hypothetical protein [Oharaeibacter diazotrophicus]TDP82606.1 hypothetical protein EDD54_3875 [Oharaeibacter diazotrophicus]BBE72630.1 hypothetical protein OHA_1_02228 [Pleomorphomonas sp. SM30]GLS76664.1 hypothetical protein GCM10007904_20010 [Oharaeibacter diazotrophicus]
MLATAALTAAAVLVIAFVAIRAASGYSRLGEHVERVDPPRPRRLAFQGAFPTGRTRRRR